MHGLVPIHRASKIVHCALALLVTVTVLSSNATAVAVNVSGNGPQMLVEIYELVNRTIPPAASAAMLVTGVLFVGWLFKTTILFSATLPQLLTLPEKVTCT